MRQWEVNVVWVVRGVRREGRVSGARAEEEGDYGGAVVWCEV